MCQIFRGDIEIRKELVAVNDISKQMIKIIKLQPGKVEHNNTGQDLATKKT